jgi:RNA polymerase II subunit A C-terminal domain phosphatase SSU72
MAASVVVNVVCQSNMNRSMAAHRHLLGCAPLQPLLKQVLSSGVGQSIKFPGPSADKPNIFPFGTTFEHIHRELQRKDEALYEKKGLLALLQRNMDIKKASQRFQDMWPRSPSDIVFCFEERVFDHVCEFIELEEKHHPSANRVHAFNLTVNDSPEDAEKGAFLVLPLTAVLCADFLTKLLGTEGWEDQISDAVAEFERDSGCPLVYALLILPDRTPESTLFGS